MTTHKLLTVNSFVGYALISIICVVIGLSVNSRRFTNTKASQSDKRILINNKTQALQVTKAEINGKLLHLALKNGYGKNVNWFRVSFGNNESVEADFTFADPSVLAPGASYEEDYSIQSDSDPLNVTIVSVLFDDKSSDGDTKYAQAIKEKRAGQQIQLKRLLPLLQRAINAPDSDTAASLRGLEMEVSTVKEEGDGPKTEGEVIGRRNAKERILNELHRIKQLRDRDSNRDIRQDLILVKERYERIISKLEANTF